VQDFADVPPNSIKSLKVHGILASCKKTRVFNNLRLHTKAASVCN